MQKAFCGGRQRITGALFGWALLSGSLGLAQETSPLHDPEAIIHPAESVMAEVDRAAHQPAPEPSLTGVIGFLGLLGGAAGFLIWWKRKRTALGGLGRSGAAIEIETTRAIGQRQFLMVARVGEERFLLGTGPQGPQLVSRLDATPAQFTLSETSETDKENAA